MRTEIRGSSEFDWLIYLLQLGVLLLHAKLERVKNLLTLSDVSGVVEIDSWSTKRASLHMVTQS